jgi:predicted RNase H-like HicB family nuclease
MKKEDYYTYVIQWSVEDNCFISRVPEFPSLSAFGKTREACLKEMELLMGETLEWMHSLTNGD